MAKIIFGNIGVMAVVFSVTGSAIGFFGAKPCKLAHSFEECLALNVHILEQFPCRSRGASDSKHEKMQSNNNT